MSATNSTTWFWSDWAGDQAVRNLTPAERGLWIDLLSLAAVGTPVGYVSDVRGDPVPVEQIARFANCTAGEASSLIEGILEKGAASRDRSGRIWNRRMVRDHALSVKRKRAGQAGGAATALKWQGAFGVPQQLPGHVPRQDRTRHSNKKKINTSDAAARAREDAREGTQQVLTAAPVEPQVPKVVSDELAATLQRRRWVR